MAGTQEFEEVALCKTLTHPHEIMNKTRKT
jgi:hypothetical protein